MIIYIILIINKGGKILKFYKKSIILLILLIVTMGVACAEDVNQDAQDTLEISDTNEVISNTTPAVKTYDDLAYDIINKSDDSITLESDYIYQESDKNDLIEFTGVDFTINGNNHVIDANNKATVFKVLNKSNLIIKNLIIRNCNDSAIVVAGSSSLITENVTFENNYLNNDLGAVIYASNSEVSSKNDKFYENYATQGGSSIFASKSVVNINNATFKNKDPIYWALIYGSGSEINVEDTVFENINSKYSTVIYNTYKTNVKKSKFINLNASLTGGALVLKGDSPTNISYMTIDNCEFINVHAGKNGGAIFADIYGIGMNNKFDGYVTISNSKFDSNSAEFGAAVLQLGGHLDISNSTFTNNAALENGGSVYTSNASVLIYKSDFINNTANNIDGLGGAVFIDYGNAIIDSSNFIDNIAGKGRAVYIFDTSYTLSDSEFYNNGDDIHTYFDRAGSSIKNCNSINSTINDKNYNLTIRYGGETIVLNPQPIKGSANDSYFNLRDLNLVTPVKNQGSMGACWAFGAAGAFESAFLIATGKTIDISENNIQNFGIRYSLFGDPEDVEAGNYYQTTSYFASWIGAIPTENDEYDELGKISSIKYDPHSYRILDAIFIKITDKQAIKEALTKYGALTLFMHGASANQKEYYNANTSSVYYYANKAGNHYVTLVGWNDTYSAKNFAKTAPGDGAWICKNSWGTEWGDEGYFYLSYYDTSLLQYSVGFSFENTETYEKLYQNELVGVLGFNKNFTTFGQIFTSDGGDIISAVGTYFDTAGTPYTINIFLNDYLVYTQSGKVPHAGYNTINLDKHFYVDDNSTFEVRFTSNSVPISTKTRAPMRVGLNYILNEKGQRMDLSEGNNLAPVKVYTYHNPFIAKNVVKYYNPFDETIFNVSNYYDSDTLLISFNGTNRTIDIVNGSGSISLGVLPSGSYPLTIYYKNQTFDAQVLIKSTIDCGPSNSMTAAYNVKVSYNVRFYDSNGVPLNKTKVTAKYDGKTISNAITEEDGSLLITLTKKPAIGKHYLDYANPVTGEILRVTISIVSRFSGNANINMYYYDGHYYKVRVKDDYGNFVGKNKVVTIKIGKKTYKVKTDAKGYAKLKIPASITPGKYKIYASYAGQTVKNTLKVKQVLKTTKTVNVKKSAKKLVLKATLKGKKAIKNKVIKFKLNGKTYKAKTNKKGIAKVTIKNTHIKKLKIKKYTIKVSYLSDVVKATLKVRR